MKSVKSLRAISSMAAKVGIELVFLDDEVVLFDARSQMPEQSALTDDPEAVELLYNAVVAAYSERIEAFNVARQAASASRASKSYSWLVGADANDYTVDATPAA